MNSIQRVTKILNHQEADFVPFRMRMDKELEATFNDMYCGGENHAVFFDDDIIHTNLCGEFVFPGTYDGITYDTLPMPDDAAFVLMKTEVDEIHARGKVAFNPYTPGMYETVTGISGVAEALMDMHLDPVNLTGRIEKVGAWHLELIKKKVATGIDILLLGDDLGTQKSLFMSLEYYRKFYKQWHVKLVREARRVNPDIKIAFHCCGHMMSLVPELIDVGIDILETLQPEAHNDRALLKKEYGKDLCFWGGIGMQSVFWGQEPAYVIEKVREALALLSEGGGYLCSPCHIATNDIPPENIKAFYDAVSMYKDYPHPGKR